MVRLPEAGIVKQQPQINKCRTTAGQLSAEHVVGVNGWGYARLRAFGQAILPLHMPSIQRIKG